MEFYQILVLVLAILVLALVSIYWFVKKKQLPRQDLPFSNSHFLSVADKNIHYQSWGKRSSTCILLMHGIGASTYSWRLLAPLLGKDFFVVALDLPGFGYSIKDPDYSHGLEEQSNFVLKFCKQLNLSQVHLVGSSMGGAIALNIARLEPKKVLSLIVISPAVDHKLTKKIRLGFISLFTRPAQFLLSKYLMRQILKETTNNHATLTDECVEQYLRPYKHEIKSLSCFIKSFDNLLNDPRMPDLFENLKIKVNILWGTHDRITPFKIAKKLQNIFPDNELYVLEKGSHHLMEDDAKWTAQTIKKIITKRTLPT